MAIALGPNGIAITGDNTCDNQDFLLGQGLPYGNLQNILLDQRFIGMREWLYDDWGLDVDTHMPMRANTALNGNISQTNHYRLDIAYDGVMNQSFARNIMPQSADFDVTARFRDACGLSTFTDIASSGNVNPDICNPGIDGPMPTSGREKYGREAYAVRIPVPPLCVGAFTNKEEFSRMVGAALRAAKNMAATAFRVEQYRWMIKRSRYNASALSTPIGNGRVQLIDQEGVFTPYKFGHVPTHWGNAPWMASMIQYSEIPKRRNVTVWLPPAILEKYKEDYIRAIGVNIWSEAQNLTRSVNGYIAQALNETLVYIHPTTGQRITFRASQSPIYVEVKSLGPDTGSWAFQEKWVKRPSEQAGQIMRRDNPNWGRQCACPNSVLGAIVTVTAEDGERPFYKEPLPSNNPDGNVRAVIAAYAKSKGVELNSSLAEFYPSVETTTIYTGLEAQVYILDPANRDARAAGSPCDIANNRKNAWMAGFTEIASQFVENAPREVANFLLLMPKLDMCSVAPIVCDEPASVPTAGDIEPEITPKYVAPIVPVDPVPPVTPEAGTIFMIGQRTVVTAPCTGTKTVRFTLERRGGLAGALSVTIAGSSTAHGGTFPTTVNFADGDEAKVVSWTIPAWSDATEDTATESYVLTLTGLDPDSWQTRTICIKPQICPGTCDVETNGCAPCGGAGA